MRARPEGGKDVRLENHEATCSNEGCCGTIPRRTFLQLAGAAAAGPAMTHLTAIAGPFGEQDTVSHFVPADKKLSTDWLRQLTQEGDRTWYRGKDLETIGMPIGGIAAGQLYLTGDGCLVYWDIFNQALNTGYGQVNYKVGRKPTERVRTRQYIDESPEIDQGFAVRIQTPERTILRRLDHTGFPGVRFCGEYPIGFVDYADAKLPVAIGLEAFSPFIPLNAQDSALPATVFQFSVKNTGRHAVDVTLAGWLENAVGLLSQAAGLAGRRLNRVSRESGATVVLSRAESETEPEPPRPPVVFADFEGESYKDWKTEGDAFGDSPARGALSGQQAVSGFHGKGLVNTFLDRDRSHGKLTSPAFTIERPFVSFLVGGGSHAEKTCVNLIIDGQVVLTATGRNDERLEWHNWDVRAWKGKTAQIVIVDAESGAWGHINVDQIEFRDTPRNVRSGPLDEQPDFGTMALAVLADQDVAACTSLPDGELPEVLFSQGAMAHPQTSQTSQTSQKLFGQSLRGAVAKTLHLDAGQTASVTFVVSWCFPNRPEHGNYYAGRFDDARHVAAYVSKNIDRLAGQTRLWHDTYYDSTLPHWLLDRLHSTVSTLATGTCEWRRNGRFWAWEGAGCCRGTCGHVWNYAHAVARLFPSLERSVREMQDFSPDGGFIPETGEIRFRGEGWRIWAGDSQAGYVLKALREHQCSADNAFLKRNWPAIRKALEFLIAQDGNADGLLEGKQHNTYDIDFYGANPMIGSLYLAALLAGEQMALELGELKFADTCRRIFSTGSSLSDKKLFNGEYFRQIVDLKEHPKFQYGDGCLSDQLFGQGWAHQLSLGYIYPEQSVRAALQAIWKYNWAPDVGPQNQAHKPERWFAYPGEAGLFTCTWPKSEYLTDGVRYKNEVWTGIEYQVAGHMAWEGMVTEALAICRAIHERYVPSKHNPWNEIECGDHYARGMASWGVLIGLSGFCYHGPKALLGFAPRISPDDFRSVFTGAKGWGTIEQKRQKGKQINRVAVKWGTVALSALAFQLPDSKPVTNSVASIDGRTIPLKWQQTDQRVLLTFTEQLSIQASQTLEVALEA